ncbi:flagellar protein FlgA [soil metagenome]
MVGTYKGKESAVAAREGRSKRFWFDPRFAIGIVLIAVAVAGTVFVVSAADSSVPVLTARSALTPGQTVTTDDLIATKVGMSRGTALYLSPSDVPADGVVVTRTVAAGELVPASAVGSSASVDSTSLVITVKGQLSGSIVAGATADVWAAPKTEDGFGAPVVIVPTATVVRLVKPAGIVVDDSSGSVEVLVPKQTVARLLEAVADQDALSLVPAALPAKD